MTSTDRAGLSGELVLRPALPQEADALAGLYGAARTAAAPAIPPPVHTPEEDRVWFAERLADGEHEAWLAEEEGQIVGYALFTASWLNHLFLRPDRTGEGIGTALLDLVKALRPDGLGLWVFESNAGAQRFYARHGFVEVRRTDGSDNEERAPDIELAWPGTH